MTTENEDKKPEEILAMSDEDFLKMSPPEVGTASTEIEESEPNQEQPPVTEPVVEEEPKQEEQSPVTDDKQTEVTDDVNEKSSESDEQNTDEEDPTEKLEQPETDKKTDQEKNTKDELKETKDSTTIDYKSFYEKIMTPFKANGKTIDLRNPDEAIQLMQMGANYTRKMQEIAPHRKTIMMLENNGLMDEGKLSFLIDLDKKNPEAIKKLIKDSGIDVLDIDTDAEPTYKESSYAVSEQDVELQSTLDSLRETDKGIETIRVIHSTWDNVSKEVLGSDPQIMSVIHQQRENGIYDRISGEIDRQKTLGKLPTGVSFLQAYKSVGDQMHEAGAFEDILGKTKTTETPAVQQQEQKQPVATRVDKPKPEVSNSEKASAASPAKSTPSPAKPNVNYLAMPDEEFLKLMNGRV